MAWGIQRRDCTMEDDLIWERGSTSEKPHGSRRRPGSQTTAAGHGMKPKISKFHLLSSRRHSFHTLAQIHKQCFILATTSTVLVISYSHHFSDAICKNVFLNLMHQNELLVSSTNYAARSKMQTNANNPGSSRLLASPIRVQLLRNAVQCAQKAEKADRNQKPFL
ncbi:uncharacterized protein BCR38DRAFT_181562 [Pseudomassariella vexata]|uniref:Uncharacterized protein n=1 Tax=Pseudomassariella vexata TaxID=1141098 RepID=A0A1Y2E5C5_9PEZI|nr:uncharacterized protein BCR38DRAFT_181562 [Pseudomassariella vexata]ORY66486.1 hypothetical protein BCR38DRAFT_181562 [Pseudomassariella vexata]